MTKAGFVNEFTYRGFLESGSEQEFDSLFERALDRVRRQMGEEYHMYIGGKEVDASSLMVENSPIDKKITVGRFQKGGREHARAAIVAAKEAFGSWSETDHRERAAIFREFADLASKNKFEFAALLSLENGKTRYESMGEVDEAIDFARYYANEIVSNKGYSRKVSVRSSPVKIAVGFQGAPPGAEKVSIRMRPYGVFGVITPFNFPVSIGAGMSIGAMITGNTVVFKPSCTENMTALTAIQLYKLFAGAGVPAGVFNVVTGPGSEVGDELAINRGVSGMVFTGSRKVGIGMIGKAYGSGSQKAFITEMGGKNPAIVSKSADLGLAVPGVISSAFGFAGQKCSALSRLYVHESVKERMISMLVESMRNMKVGNPLQKGTFMGPLISESTYKRYNEAVEEIKKSGRLLFGGKTVNTGLNGFYVEPVLGELRQAHELVRKELFAPILIIIPFKDFQEALDMANDSEYGLAAGLYSMDRREAELFSDKMDSGVLYINRKVGATTGAVVGLHAFTGWKGSGITGKGTGSRFYLGQFMREQSISTSKG